MLKLTDDTRMITGDCIVSNSILGYHKGFAYESIRSFLNCLQSGKEFLVPVTDCANVCLALLDIMESAKTGKIITCEHV